jgi:ATP-dependent Lon protease
MDRLNRREVVLPLIPLRELVTFPATIVPILVGRPKSIDALKASIKDYDHYLFLSVQKNQLSENPQKEEIHPVGTISRIEKTIEQHNGSHRVVIQGLQRGRIMEYIQDGLYFLARIEILEEKEDKTFDPSEMSRQLIHSFESYIETRNVKLQSMVSKLEANQLSGVTDIIISVLQVSVKIKQSLLEDLDPFSRGQKIQTLLKKEIYKLEKKKDREIKPRKDDPHAEDMDKLRKKITDSDLPQYVLDRALEEMDRLEVMPPFSAESTVSRYYIDWLLAIPWKKNKRENRDIKKARDILDTDHYGLTDVKDRILEYLAVRQLNKNANGEILCFVGPPGVGKSSLGKSIARALNRPFVRVSLGGVKDEAEIRGHRRTYIGSYPGQLVKGLKKAGAMNPVFLLDEIDKLASDHRGDPSSALLEALDPEQNAEFIDHYLDLEVDLSGIFFITTANSVAPIPPALRDRMEIIELSSYTNVEKNHIASAFLLPKQIEKNGLKGDAITLEDPVMQRLIEEYTREAGVRNLEREIGKLTRKIARKYLEDGSRASFFPFRIKATDVEQLLGIPRYQLPRLQIQSEAGVAVGLAWTPSGGDVLVVESRLVRGKGKIILTGRMGEVMQESSRTAWSYSKIRLYELAYLNDDMDRYDIHLHIPEGATPKDGPSAGITLATAMISMITGIPVRSQVAMTGEITLRGRVLPVGGIKEKVLAAHRFGIQEILIPVDNRKEYEHDIPRDIQEKLSVHFVETMEDVIEKALESPISVANCSSPILKSATGDKLQ